MVTRNDLIICIGNVARGDDGVAHRVAALLRERLDPAGLQTLVATDLDVAMAEDISSARRVLIVDAERREHPAVAVRAIQPGPSGRPTGHGIDPTGLLGIASALYGAVPIATLWSVAAPEMGHGEGLSDAAEAAADDAAAAIAHYLETYETPA